MSLKKILGLENCSITDCEIMSRIKEAQRTNMDDLEFDAGEQHIKISLPHISFDPDCDKDFW